MYRNSWRTRDDAENALFGYIDGWYNTQRIQKKLGWRSPDEYEASYHHQFLLEPGNPLSGLSGEPQDVTGPQTATGNTDQQPRTRRSRRFAGQNQPVITRIEGCDRYANRLG
ncbi:IS3 family transposase [Nocardia nova]|uniref:IS3 family transposase n=1 Tax=Nocardia nova TaxID=37330 RepID=UPI000CE9C64D|nr:hypothetical protein C5E46_00030 [Nocardia nova]